MSKDFLSTLLGRSQRGELIRPGQFQDELGARVADLAGQIQDVDAHFASVVARVGVDRNLARPGDEHTARTLFDTFRELRVKPLIKERDVCTDRLIVDKALGVNRENPGLAAALLALVTD